MRPETWFAYATLNFLFDIAPGPAVALTIAHAGSRGFRAGLGVAAGVEIGNMVYFSISALGLGVFIAQSDVAFRIIQYAGCAYLVLLGLLAVRSAWIAASEPPQPAIWRHPVIQGAVNQLSNPKSILFYAALLPQFIDSRTALLPQLLILAVTGIVIEVPILAAYAAAAAAGGALIGGDRARWSALLSGLALLFAAGAILLVSHGPAAPK